MSRFRTSIVVATAIITSLACTGLSAQQTGTRDVQLGDIEKEMRVDIKNMLEDQLKDRLQVVNEYYLQEGNSQEGKSQEGNVAQSRYYIGVQCAMVAETEVQLESLGAMDFGTQTTYLKAGLIVNSLIEGGPAETVGVEVGDIIVSFNGVSLTSIEEFSAVIEEAGESETKMVVVRDKKAIEVKITPRIRETVDLDGFYESDESEIPFSDRRILPVSRFPIPKGHQVIVTYDDSGEGVLTIFDTDRNEYSAPLRDPSRIPEKYHNMVFSILNGQYNLSAYYRAIDRESFRQRFQDHVSGNFQSQQSVDVYDAFRDGGNSSRQLNQAGDELLEINQKIDKISQTLEELKRAVSELDDN